MRRWYLLLSTLLLAGCQSERAAVATQALEQLPPPVPAGQLAPDSGAVATLKKTGGSCPAPLVATGLVPKATTQPVRKRGTFLARPRVRIARMVAAARQLGRLRFASASHDANRGDGLKSALRLLAVLVVGVGGLTLIFLAANYFIRFYGGGVGIALGFLVTLLGLIALLALFVILFLAVWGGTAKPIKSA